MVPYRWAGLVAVVAVGITLVLATGDSGGRRTHQERDTIGVLSASSGFGGQSFAVPDDVTYPWSGSFGAYELCVLEEGQEVEIEAVRYESTVEPLDMQVWLRKVAAGEHLVDGDGLDYADSYGQNYGSIGKPPRFDGRSAYEGDYTTDVVGTVIDQPCSTQHDDLTAGYTTMIFTLTAGEEGAQIPRRFIDYRVGDDLYTLEINWEIALCGTAPELAELCDQDPASDDGRP